MQRFILLITVIALFSCSGNQLSKGLSPGAGDSAMTDHAVAVPGDSAQVITTNVGGKPQTIRMQVKDKSQYSELFINKLSKSGYAKTYELINEKLILDGEDTNRFPTFLPLNRMVNFAGYKSGLHYNLKLTRKDYTTVEYRFERYEKGKLRDEETGEAMLGPSFFMASETDDDDQTGNAYDVVEYSDSKAKNDCWFIIRVGNDHGRYKAKITRACDKSEMSIYIDDCPTLRKK